LPAWSNPWSERSVWQETALIQENEVDNMGPERLTRVLQRAIDGESPNEAESAYMLAFPFNAVEAGMIRAAANAIGRRRFAGEAMLLGQIGVAMAPCDGGCHFCAFAKPHTTVKPSTLSSDEAIERAKAFARGGVAGVFIMTMHRFGFDWFVDLVAAMRKATPREVVLLANVGDVSANQVSALKSAGLSGAYHVCRLREGIDTRVAPEQRIRTIETIRMAGMDWYNSCEPIGPEHSAEEIAAQIHLGLRLGCRQHAAMRRFSVPGSPLFHHGQLPLGRLAQIVAVIAMASVNCAETQSIAVHEPNVLGLMSGANALYPEAGEPLPSARDFPDGSGRDGFSSALWRRSQEITTMDCRRMLRESGFAKLRRGDGTVAAMDANIESEIHDEIMPDA
jgi:biotin synthase